MLGLPWPSPDSQSHLWMYARLSHASGFEFKPFRCRCFLLLPKIPIVSSVDGGRGNQGDPTPVPGSSKGPIHTYWIKAWQKLAKTMWVSSVFVTRWSELDIKKQKYLCAMYYSVVCIIIMSFSFHHKLDRRCDHNYSYCNCHFTVEETSTERWRNMPKVTQLLSPSTEIGTQAFWLQSPRPYSSAPRLWQFTLLSISSAWPELRTQHKFQKFQFQLDPTDGWLEVYPEPQFSCMKNGNIPCFQDWGG